VTARGVQVLAATAPSGTPESFRALPDPDDEETPEARDAPDGATLFLADYGGWYQRQGDGWVRIEPQEAAHA
jgi:hypothetical protein